MSAAAVIGAIGNAAGAMASQAIGNATNLKAQKDLFNYTAPLNQGLQYDMVRRSPELMVQGYKRAGLNPAGINSSYQGAAASGDTNAATQPLNMDLLNGAMAAVQMENESKLNAANVRKLEAEAVGQEKANSWLDRLNQSQLDTQAIQRDLWKHQDQREFDKLNSELALNNANLDLLHLQKSYDELRNEAMNKEYEFEGKKIKGSEIENFQALYTLEMAKKTLAVDWYSAMTGRIALDRDWKAVLTTKWLAPLAEDLAPIIKQLSPTLQGEAQRILDSIKGIMDTVKNVREGVDSASKFLLNPFGSISKYLKDHPIKLGWQGDIFPGLK